MRFGVLYWDIYMIRSLYLYPEKTESEQRFCQLLVDEINMNKAKVEIKNECLLLQLSDNTKHEMQLKSIDECFEKEEKIKTLIDAIDKVKVGKLIVSSKVSCQKFGLIISISIDFDVNFKSESKIKLASMLNKREEGKRKRSIWRRPTPPKNKNENWERTYT